MGTNLYHIFCIYIYTILYIIYTYIFLDAVLPCATPTLLPHLGMGYESVCVHLPVSSMVMARREMGSPWLCNSVEIYGSLVVNHGQSWAVAMAINKNQSPDAEGAAPAKARRQKDAEAHQGTG